MVVKIRFNDEANPGDIIQFRVHLKPGQYAHWSEIRQKVEELSEKKGLQAYIIKPIVDKVNGALPTAKHVMRTDEQLLRDYAKSRAIDDRTLDVGIKLL